ncbi:ATP-binding cassette protein 3, putative [Anopheles sinensis]|uniref:ATP-binding cassette protein 3, putative n=1 Tax=Anopheles sinensis TaxID=74873 RepID=A0A084VGJ1_ANOSI|nr:ATP-binding cassette protein 3, putative [Anopheles sinensis]
MPRLGMQDAAVAPKMDQLASTTTVKTKHTTSDDKATATDGGGGWDSDLLARGISCDFGSRKTGRVHRLPSDDIMMMFLSQATNRRRRDENRTEKGGLERVQHPGKNRVQQHSVQRVSRTETKRHCDVVV